MQAKLNFNFWKANLYLVIFGYSESHQAPIHRFSDQVLPPHNAQWRQTGITIMYLYTANRYFSGKKLTNVLAGWSVLITSHCWSVLLNAVQNTDTVRSLLWLWRLSCTYLFKLMSLICANKDNGIKFCLRKSMWAVDEKLIINELRP